MPTNTTYNLPLTQQYLTGQSYNQGTTTQTQQGAATSGYNLGFNQGLYGSSNASYNLTQTQQNLTTPGYNLGYNYGLYNSGSYLNTPLFNYNQYTPMNYGCYDTFGGFGMFGSDCCHCHCDHGHGHRHDDSFDGFGKALLIGGGAALGIGLIAAFHKPIGKFLGNVGNNIWKGIKWTGQKIGKGASWLWNNTLGRLFKKKSSKVNTDTQNTTQTQTAKTE